MQLESLRPERIFEAREEAGMTSDDLAYAMRRLSGGELRTTGKQVRRWESGRNQPRVDALKALAVATRKPLDFFFDHELVAAG